MIVNARIEKLIEILTNKGISDSRVLQAIRVVPRDKFVAPGMEHKAWEDQALPIGYGQTISRPSSVALMTQHLNINRNDRILEIGTGSGYQAALLCELGAQVFSIERIKELSLKAQKTLNALRYHCIFKIGDGTLGWQQYAPFDGIIVTAGAPVTPDTLMGQLKNGGRLIIPVGNKRNEQILTLYVKKDDGFESQEIDTLSFVPLIGRKGW
ncbi:MAG: protein-L-isoaspartate(D-aspartate) O-methyltransferase [Calditrichaceae bacterium]|nr:protein-L-isoaspartate(D-aspartate) O-methyltransferase [Calditrichaceae bacterium]MBN2709878.1 protein-L-isoaspartate(D-aspartate) O-methyltransferase [Calditrichaceae bacterium]RQV92634.1 MAG: protein-L-isoaspartate(D-aspartate) O-methyltransferase [Calditrichota bacterium]